MASRRRQGGPEKSGDLPLPTGGSDKKSRGSSSSSGSVLVILVVLATVAAGVFVFRAEIEEFVSKQGLTESTSDRTEADISDRREPVRREAESDEIPEPPTADPISADSTGQEDTPPPASSPASESSNKDRLLTVEELKQFDGSDESKPIYLAMLGQVFDVTKGKQHYGKDGGYGFFAGKDGTRAFVSGEFTEDGLVADVTGLDNAKVIGIEEWLGFYHKDYTYVGKLIGTYYDENGQTTETYAKYREMLKAAQGANLAEEEFRKLFPPCNSHWAQGKGGSVWCSKESGGINRDWAGVPRRYFKAGSDNYKCVCVRTTGAPSSGEDDKRNIGDLGNPNLRTYNYCHPESATCKMEDDK